MFITMIMIKIMNLRSFSQVVAGLAFNDNHYNHDDNQDNHDNFDDNRDNYDDNHDNYDDNQDTCEVSLKVLLDSVSLLVSPQPYTHPVEPGICP